LAQAFTSLLCVDLTLPLDHFWTNSKFFLWRMLPVVRIYLKEVGNHLSALTKQLGGGEALKFKGSLGLKWHRMKEAAGMQARR